MKKEKILKILYKKSLKAYSKNEVPVSAILLRNNKVISTAYNNKNIKSNALLHAEIICLQKAYKRLKRWNLNDCILYVSLEPCDMCKQLIQESRINKVYYLQKRGVVNNKYNKTQYEQMFVENNNDDFDGLMSNFFHKLREKK